MKKITEMEFADLVVLCEGVQVVHFYNPYSDHSNATDEILGKLYKRYEDVQFFKINLLHCEILCDRYGISIPSVLVFEDGVLQDILPDVLHEEALVNRLSSLSAPIGDHTGC